MLMMLLAGFKRLLRRDRDNESKSTDFRSQGIQQLQSNREILKGLEKRLCLVSQRIKQAAEKALHEKEVGNVAACKFHLKHKRMLLSEQTNLHGQMLNITQSIQALEQSLMTCETM